MHCKDQKESTQETSQESQDEALGGMLLATREQEGQKKAADRTVCGKSISLDREDWRKELQGLREEVYTDQEEKSTGAQN